MRYPLREDDILGSIPPWIKSRVSLKSIMKKFFLPLIGIATLIIIFGGIFLFSNQKSTPVAPTPLPTTYEYFWGNGCPHCAIVEEFLSSWEGRDKVQIDKKEVWSNRQNAALMRERATYCGLPLKNLGVPFLFTPEGKCIGGDEPIIEFFKELKF